MKKIIIISICLLIAICSYSQEHIKFNGATFGKPYKEFVKGFPQKSFKSSSIYHPKGYNSSLCRHQGYLIDLNSQYWNCHIYSSITSDIVFRTVSVNRFWDLRNDLMLLVKTLEEKYGGGINEKQDNLGEIYNDGRYYREMLALYYYIKGTNGRVIGEIRIAAAPFSTTDTKTGWIELSYTDYSSRDKATREYNSKMRNAL